jgi:hypothetical protein
MCDLRHDTKQEISMKSIRNYVYAAALTLSALNFAPSLASAQDDGGRFTLPHEVLWQNTPIPAGDYRFTLQPVGPLEMLKLSKISGTPASFMLMVNDTEATNGSETARLVIRSRPGNSYVSSMTLPQYEVTLHFATPKNSEKEMAQLQPSSVSTPAR